MHLLLRGLYRIRYAVEMVNIMRSYNIEMM